MGLPFSGFVRRRACTTLVHRRRVPSAAFHARAMAVSVTVVAGAVGGRRRRHEGQLERAWPAAPRARAPSAREARRSAPGTPGSRRRRPRPASPPPPRPRPRYRSPSPWRAERAPTFALPMAPDIAPTAATAAACGSPLTTNVTGFSFSSVSVSTNVAVSPAESRESGSAAGAGGGAPSSATGGGFTSIVPTRNFAVSSSRFGGWSAPGATVTA